MTYAPLLLGLTLAIAPLGEAAGAGGPSILHFHSAGSDACRRAAPEVDRLASAGYPVRSFDVEERRSLLEEYDVVGVPTFLVVDRLGREITRREGFAEASELARLLEAARSFDAAAERDSDVYRASRPRVEPASASPPSTNPRPWATVARIRVEEQGQMGFGSGTVIHSDEDESVILTCAHIFKVSRGRRQPPAERFRLPVWVELFDGRLTGPTGQKVSPRGRQHRGEVIDYDFDRDVALLRIRPGEVVPSARVVPPHWAPKAKMRMTTVGCSHGRDATAWTTLITDPIVGGMTGNPRYRAIQCLYSPKQGRSGGGLFTDDGYVAGVCNFAFDPRISRGLYAAPSSIYGILDKNGFADLYEPMHRNPGIAIASNRGRRDGAGGAAPGSRGELVVRSQTPSDEGPSSARGSVLGVQPITVQMPSPEQFGAPRPESSPSLARLDRSGADSGSGDVLGGWRGTGRAEPLEVAASERPPRPAPRVTGTDRGRGGTDDPDESPARTRGRRSSPSEIRWPSQRTGAGAKPYKPIARARGG